MLCIILGCVENFARFRFSARTLTPFGMSQPPVCSAAEHAINGLNGIAERFGTWFATDSHCIILGRVERFELVRFIARTLKPLDMPRSPACGADHGKQGLQHATAQR